MNQINAAISTDKIIVHDYEGARKVQEALLDKADILPENRESIKDFINFCRSREEIGESRSAKYLFLLRRIAELIDTPFKEMSEKDMNKLLTSIQEMRRVDGKPLASNTKTDFRIAISRFWRWLYYVEYKGEAPPQIRGLKTTHRNGQKEPEIYTKEEIKELIDSLNTIRDKAFFSCLYDLGCRVGELLSRKLKHVKYDDEGNVQIFIEADKTGVSHWETLYESVGQFATWLRLHPKVDDLEAPLWVVQRKNGLVIPLSYALARKLFISAIKRKGIRRLKVHTIRKSKATHDLADGVPVTYIEARGSWKKGSRALQDCYFSVQQKDKDNAYKKKYNILVNNGEKEIRELQRCKRCDSLMEKNTKFCARCGMPADLKTAIEAKKIDNQITSLIDKDMLSEMVKRYVIQELKNKKTKDKRK